MNFKSTLWALAFACAAVSCSDDLENGPNNNEGNELNGPTTYMKVNISSNITTKAEPIGGEGVGTEVGSEKEYDVDDVTVILFKNADNSPVSAINANSVLVAAGYENNVSSMNESQEPQHDRMATVTLSVTDATENFDGNTYGVIAVTNLGSDALKNRIKSTDINTGSKLANYLQISVHTDGTKFIMSSHLPTVETVTLRADATKTDAPEANIHVERLAAKIRINEYKSAEVGNNFIYEIKSGADNANLVAKVRLDQVAIVNQLNSGTYLLKRVSGNASSESNSIPAEGNDAYLKDEFWTATSANYVIDPWTRNKTQENVTKYTSISAATNVNYPTGTTAKPLGYSNPFSGSNYDAMWTAISTGSKSLSSTGTITSPIDLAYTQENTTEADNSLMGYTTGAIFKATYYPASLSAIGTGDNDGKIIAEPQTGIDNFNAATVTNTVPTFYVYQNVAYKTLETIWAEFVWKIQTTDEARLVIDYHSFNSDNIVNMTKKKFMNSDLAKYEDPFGYIAYLKTEAGKLLSDDVKFVATNAFSAYINNNKAKYADKIKTYTHGQCYYPYWIRHANNNLANEMGIMEFGIVRNNIYDLTVTGISGFGISGTDEPDPEQPVEKDDFYLKVNLYVRNWVVRSNSGIIL